MGWSRRERPKRSLVVHLFRYVCCNSEQDHIDWWDNRDQKRAQRARPSHSSWLDWLCRDGDDELLGWEDR